MKTKYGDIPDITFEKYRKSLINRIWSLIPLKEEQCKTLDTNIKRLNRELTGMIKVVNVNDEYVITVINLLENLLNPQIQENFNEYKSDVFRCCELMNHVDSIAEDGDENV